MQSDQKQTVVSKREMLADCNDGIGQSIFSIFIPSARMHINRGMIRKLSATIGQIAKPTEILNSLP